MKSHLHTADDLDLLHEGTYTDDCKLPRVVSTEQMFMIIEDNLRRATEDLRRSSSSGVPASGS